MRRGGAAEPALHDRVRVGKRPLAQPRRGFGTLASPGTVDLVLTIRYVHDWIESGSLRGAALRL